MFYLKGGQAQEVVDPPFLEELKASLDGVLSRTISWVATLPMAEGWNWVILEVLYNISHSMILRNISWISFIATHILASLLALQMKGKTMDASLNI